MNNDGIIQSVSAQVYRQYPEFKGVHPEVRWTSSEKTNRCTLTYQTTIRTANGKNLHRRVKVICNTDGKIQKISTSK